MSDSKSKMPDISEITSMAGKLFSDVKKSISEIIADYKANRPAAEEGAESADAEKAAEPAKKAKEQAAKSEEPKAEESKAEVKAEPEAKQEDSVAEDKDK